jgi:hypothetical protein
VERPLARTTLTLGVVAAGVGALNAVLGFASAEVSGGLALFVVLLGGIYIRDETRTTLSPPTPAAQRDIPSGYESTVGNIFAGEPWGTEPPAERWPPIASFPRPAAEPPPRPSRAHAHYRPLGRLRRPTLARVALIIGIVAGIVTIVNGSIEFVSKVT